MINLMDLLETTFNNKKLKMSRKKRKISIEEVSDATGIPIPTLQKYEAGSIKKIPLDSLKKICDYYGTDYYFYYGWTKFPLLGTFSGIVLSYLIGIPLTTSISAGYLTGVFGIGIFKKYFELKKEKEDTKELYDILNLEEKKDYERFRTIVNTYLRSDEIFSPKELKKEELYLFSYFLAHKLKKEVGNNGQLSPYNIEEAEIIINDK